MLNRAKAGRHAGMARAIERHRRWQAAAARLSRDGDPPNGWVVGALLAAPARLVARLIERSARRRLMRRKPADPTEARQKILYLMAAAIAQTTELSVEEVAEISASVAEFQHELDDFLQTRRPQASAQDSLGKSHPSPAGSQAGRALSSGSPAAEP